MLKMLQEQEADYSRQIDELKIKLETVRESIRRAKGEPEPKSARGRRGLNVKSYLLQLLEQQGPMGLNANQAVELAAKDNKVFERGTVSSLLSRFKGDVAYYDGQVYRLNKYANVAMPGTRTENVVQHPASKAAS
jgi:hypothetical protein